MTNLEAFMIKYQDETLGSLILSSADITPASEDQNELSYALGVWQYLAAPEYKQGQTSEKLSNAAMSHLRSEAIRIFKKYDYTDYSKGLPTITSERW